MLLRKKYSVVFVCTANVTRSPYFAGLLQYRLRRMPRFGTRRIQVGSAGTHAMPGRPVDTGVALIAEQQGFNLSRHCSRPFNKTMARKSDLILTMDTLQKKDMMEKYAELKNRVFTVIEFGRDGQIPKMQDIQDPTGREPERYRQFCRQAEAETERIIHELMYRTAPS